MALTKTPQGLMLNADIEAIARSMQAREELKRNAQNQAVQASAAAEQVPPKRLNMYEITPDKGRFLDIVA